MENSVVIVCFFAMQVNDPIIATVTTATTRIWYYSYLTGRRSSVTIRCVCVFAIIILVIISSYQSAPLAIGGGIHNLRGIHGVRQLTYARTCRLPSTVATRALSCASIATADEVEPKGDRQTRHPSILVYVCVCLFYCKETF